MSVQGEVRAGRHEHVCGVEEIETGRQRGPHPPEVPEEQNVIARSRSRQVRRQPKYQWVRPHDREDGEPCRDDRVARDALNCRRSFSVGRR